MKGYQHTVQLFPYMVGVIRTETEMQREAYVIYFNGERILIPNFVFVFTTNTPLTEADVRKVVAGTKGIDLIIPNSNCCLEGKNN